MAKINIKNTDKIQALLDSVQARSQVRNLSLDDIKDEIEKIEKRLEVLKVAKKYWKDMTFSVSPFSQQFPGAYKYMPEGTKIEIIRGSNDWFITRIFRGDVNEGVCNELVFQNEYNYKPYYKF